MMDGWMDGWMDDAQNNKHSPDNNPGKPQIFALILSQKLQVDETRQGVSVACILHRSLNTMLGKDPVAGRLCKGASGISMT